jgi:hypothetical protein
MSASFESIALKVWQQSLIDKKKTVDLDGESYTVRHTSKSRLKQIDFRFEDRDLRGLEQNPNTKSRWAKLAREGKQVMQFLEHGTYIAVVVDGKVHLYKQTWYSFAGKGDMVLIKLRKANETGEDEGVVFVNTDQIVSISAGQNMTEINLADGRTQWVKDTPEEVVALAKSSGS